MQSHHLTPRIITAGRVKKQQVLLACVFEELLCIGTYHLCV